MALKDVAERAHPAWLPVGMYGIKSSDRSLLLGQTAGQPVDRAALLSPCRIRLWAVFGAVILVLWTAVSHQSFWIDEANSAWRAAEPSFAQFLQTMQTDDGSDAQMPLFLVTLWAWEKLAGHTEWALRAMNLLWFVPGLYFFANGRIERLLVTGASSFVWFYLDEARPYGMQLGTSLLLFGLLERAILAGASQDKDRLLLRPHEAWLLVLSLVGLAGSSLLGAIWSGAAVFGAGLAVKWHRQQLMMRALIAPGIVLTLVMVVMAAYYGWTLKQGARGTAVAGTDVSTLIFAVYELLGLAGLGPGRTEARVGGVAAFAPHLVPLVVLAALSATLAIAGTIHIWRTVPHRIIFTALLAASGAAILIMAAGYLVHWRVVGRHLTPVLPLILAVQAAGLAAAWNRPAGKAVVVGFLVLGLVSAASTRFAPRHAKDDYRSAAAAAQMALMQGERVWWSADKFGALLYDLRLGDGCGAVKIVFSPEKDFADGWPAPTLVVMSKPDIYDAHGTITSYLKQNRFIPISRFMAFDVWKNADPAAHQDCRTSVHGSS